MGNGPTIRIGVDPALFDALGEAGQAVKAQKANVKSLQSEMKKMAQQGKEVSSDLAGKLSKAQADLERLESTRDMLRGGRGVPTGGPMPVSRRSVGGGEGGGEGLTAGGIRGELREMRHIGGLARGIASGDPAEVLHGLRGVLGRGSGVAGALAIGVTGLVTAYHEYKEGMQDIDNSYKAKYASFHTVNDFQKRFGLNIANTMAQSDEFRKRFVEREKQKLGWFDQATAEYAEKNSLFGGAIRGVSDFLGITTRGGELEKRAEESEKKGFEEASKHLEQALNAAELGDIARAEKEQSAASKAAAVSLTAVGLGSPVTMYFRSQQAKLAHKVFERNERPRRMRIGQYE